MAEDLKSSLTQLLAASGRGDAAARQQVWTLIYDELHRLAQRQLAGEPPVARGHPTSLVHEAYLRLTSNVPVDWANRRHFFAAAAQAMRRIRVDDARRRGRGKRGGGRPTVTLDESAASHAKKGDGSPAAACEPDPVDLLALDEALDKLAGEYPRTAEVVTLRFFGELCVEETAQVLGVSPRTVNNEWEFARTWLHRELSNGDFQPRQGR
ncbi:MAG: ECF-type sigma factor [Planctomycetota bacterium]